jgi:hypothetical protein
MLTQPSYSNQTVNRNTVIVQNPQGIFCFSFSFLGSGYSKMEKYGPGFTLIIPLMVTSYFPREIRKNTKEIHRPINEKKRLANFFKNRHVFNIANTL